MKHIPALVLWVAVVFCCSLLAIDALITEDDLAAAKVQRHISELSR